MRACGIDPGVRPGTLTPEAFNTLAQMLDRSALDRTSAGR